MNCDEARRHWNLYYDSEGESELYFQINEHLEICPACAEWFHKQSRLEGLIAERLCGNSPPTATPELWQNVLAHSGLVQPVAATRRWLLFGGILALAASLLVAVLLWPGGKRAAASDLAQLTAEYHEQFVAGRKAVQFASTSDLEVDNYLQSQVSFPVRCPPRQDAGFLVRGAGVCRNPGVEVAYLVGRVEDAAVSIFILSKDDLAHFPKQFQAVRRDGIHHCREGRNRMVMAEIDRSIVLVVGPADNGRLLRVLKAYGTYPDGHHG
ncbi:MAG: hypothetical protein KY476_04490 [Planctomycetes bacterium]|nr:hypothetical protein [Planctomycetota bacterium]